MGNCRIFIHKKIKAYKNHLFSPIVSVNMFCPAVGPIARRWIFNACVINSAIVENRNETEVPARALLSGRRQTYDITTRWR